MNILNKIKTLIIFFIVNILFVIVISTILFWVLDFFNIDYNHGYTTLFIVSLLWGFVGSLISLFLSKWMAKRFYNIKILNESEISSFDDKTQFVYNKIKELSEEKGIKMPEVGIYDDSEPNAFATGASKNSALIAISTGLLDNMPKDAIEGVLGHEISHITSGDMLTMTLLQGVVNTFVIFFSRILVSIVTSVIDKDSFIIDFILTVFFDLLLGFLALPIVMKYSRIREFKADYNSAKLVGKEKMISALQILKSLEDRLVHSSDNENEAFTTFKIESKKGSGLKSLFMSHPSLDDRIKALEEARLTA